MHVHNVGAKTSRTRKCTVYIYIYIYIFVCAIDIWIFYSGYYLSRTILVHPHNVGAKTSRTRKCTVGIYIFMCDRNMDILQ